MVWDYAELSKMAKANGGPEKLVDILIKSGKKKMLPWLGATVAVGVGATLAVQKVCKHLSDKKAESDADLESAKQELIQGIKNYDASCGAEGMNRDDYINSVTIGERKPHNAEIVLTEYNPDWVLWYEKEAARIKTALGDKTLQIHHVGSTSVPGLCAKPVIDILLLVRDSADESRYVPPMEAAGYTLRIREPDWFEHRLFRGPDVDTNVHVFSEGCEEATRMLAFRDWLREHEDDCNLYANTKWELAKRKWEHIQHYADAKNDVVAEIMTRIKKGT